MLSETRKPLDIVMYLVVSAGLYWGKSELQNEQETLIPHRSCRTHQRQIA